MKKLLVLACLALFALPACTQKNKDMKTLVVYFSASGTTKQVAQQLAKSLNADIFEIQPQEPYTNADLDWTNKQSRSTLEMNDKSSRPAIAKRCENIADYDRILIGFPIWWYTAPTIINTFIEAHDLSGKTLLPFATSGGSTPRQATQDLRKAYPDYKFEEGVLLNRRTDIDNFLKKL